MRLSSYGSQTAFSLYSPHHEEEVVVVGGGLLEVEVLRLRELRGDVVVEEEQHRGVVVQVAFERKL